MRTVPEVARQLNRHPETIRRWIREGKLRAVKVGTQHLIDDLDLASVAPTRHPAGGSLPAVLSAEATAASIHRVREERSRQVKDTIATYLPHARAWPPSLGEVDTWLPAIVGRIVRLFDPQRILLFGSRARGDAGVDSDYDILVVLDEAPNPRERRIAIRRALADLPVAIDIVVVAADKAGQQAARRIGVTKAAFGEGREIYARQ